MNLKAEEFAAQMFVSAETLNRLSDEQRAEVVSRSIARALVDYMVVNGVKALETSIYADDSDKEMRGAVEISFIGDGIPDLTLLALTAMQAKRQDALAEALFKVNDVSWWKFLWLKLRGRRLVEI